MTNFFRNNILNILFVLFFAITVLFFLFLEINYEQKIVRVLITASAIFFALIIQVLIQIKNQILSNKQEIKVLEASLTCLRLKLRLFADKLILKDRKKFYEKLNNVKPNQYMSQLAELNNTERVCAICYWIGEKDVLGALQTPTEIYENSTFYTIKYLINISNYNLLDNFLSYVDKIEVNKTRFNTISKDEKKELSKNIEDLREIIQSFVKSHLQKLIFNKESYNKKSAFMKKLLVDISLLAGFGVVYPLIMLFTCMNDFGLKLSLSVSLSCFIFSIFFLFEYVFNIKAPNVAQRIVK